MSSSSPLRQAVSADVAPSVGLTFVLALACGVVVANIYYVQPLAGLISRDFGLPLSSTGLLVTLVQVGYATGLLLIVPLADIAENRRLILCLLAILVVALGTAAVTPSLAAFLAASVLIGIGASSVQVIVPFAGHLAPDVSRGKTVGTVVSGLLFGIMLSRPLASFAAQGTGHRSIFAFSAAAVAFLAIFLGQNLPRRQPHGPSYASALRSLGPLLLHTPILRRRGAYQAALFGTFSLFWTAVPLLLAGPRFGFSQVGIGLFALVGAAGACVSPLAGSAADRGRTHLVTGLSLAGGCVALLLGLVGAEWRSWPLLVASGLLLDTAAAASLVVGQRAILSVGAAARGRLNGLYLAVFFFAGALSSLASGYAYVFGGWTAVSAVGLILLGLALSYYATEKRATTKD